MSKQLINAYRNQLDKIIRFGGTKNETSVRRAFISLINSYAEKKNLLLVEEVGVMGKAGKTLYPDGTLKNSLRIEFGYWESKDEKDTLEDEVHQKLSVKGYPDNNICLKIRGKTFFSKKAISSKKSVWMMMHLIESSMPLLMTFPLSFINIAKP